MLTISADDMQRDLPDYLKLVESGETLLITQANKLIAEVKPIAAPAMQPRPFGLAKGEFVVPGDFDEPLPDDFS